MKSGQKQESLGDLALVPLLLPKIMFASGFNASASASA